MQQDTQPLTVWRAKDRQHQQVWNTARCWSHSLPGEPRTGIISRLEKQQDTEATHSLKSQGQASSTGWKCSKAHSHSLPGEPGTSIVSRLETQQTSHLPTGEPSISAVSQLEIQLSTTATYMLESQGQVSSAGLKHSRTLQPPTFWRAKDKH